MLLHNTITPVPPQIDAFDDAEREERYASALTFLRGLFEPTDTICIWLIHQETKKQKWFIQSFAETTETETFEQLDQLQAEGWDVYMCMNPLQAGSTARKKENVAQIRTGYLDLDADGPAKLDEVNKAVEAGEIPAPRFTVSSSVSNDTGMTQKKYQISWRLVDATKEQQEALLDALIARFGGDKAASDCTRILRLPGFKNLKYSEQPLVLILKQTDSVATLDQFKILSSSNSELESSKEPYNYTLPEPGTKIAKDRNIAVRDFAFHEWVYEGCPSVEELRERVYLFNDTFIQPPLEKSELDSTVLSSTPKKQQRKDLYITFDGYRGGESPYLQQQATETVTATTSAGLKFSLPAVKGGIFDFVVEPLGFSSEGWFPLGSPSLVGGKSGSAKSTWMLDLLLKQAKKEPFLNHSTCGRPFLVLMADRGEDSHKRTMHRMGMANENIPITFFSPKIGLSMWQEIVDKIEEANIPQIVFIEGADFLVEDGNKKQCVTPFMTALQKIAEHYHIAIIGSVGAPKTKMGEGYTAKRDSISGSEAWSRLAETVVTLQYPDGEDTSDCREVSVLLRNGPSESFSMKFRDGRLVPLTEEERKRAENKDPVLDWVQLQSAISQSDPAKQWWTRQDMRKQLGLAKSTAGDWIADAHSKGLIVMKPGEKTKGNGKANEYQWNASETNPKHRPVIDQN